MGFPDYFKKFFKGPNRVDLWKRFERLRESTSGTMSAFYKVRDLGDGEIRGLKVIDQVKSAPVEGRYRGLGKPCEGEIGMLVIGPHIARTLEWGESTTADPFVLQEFVEGTVLHTMLSAKKSLPTDQRLGLIRQAAEAITTVHDSGFVHRDICPRNFILRPDGRLILFDFGLTVPDKPVFLQPGNRIGTPNYMAPEVVRRRQADKRLDIFSFGVTAYEIATLTAPWPRGKTGMAALAHDSPPTPIEEHWPEIPPLLGAAIMACLAAEPGKRPESMQQFLKRIETVAV